MNDLMKFLEEYLNNKALNAAADFLTMANPALWVTRMIYSIKNVDRRFFTPVLRSSFKYSDFVFVYDKSGNEVKTLIISAVDNENVVYYDITNLKMETKTLSNFKKDLVAGGGYYKQFMLTSAFNFFISSSIEVRDLIVNTDTKKVYFRDKPNDYLSADNVNIFDSNFNYIQCYILRNNQETLLVNTFTGDIYFEVDKRTLMNTGTDSGISTIEGQITNPPNGKVIWHKREYQNDKNELLAICNRHGVSMIIGNVNIENSWYHANERVLSKGNHNKNKKLLYTPVAGKKVDLVTIPLPGLRFLIGGTVYQFHFKNTMRNCLNISLFGAMIGALVHYVDEGGTAILKSTGFAFADNTCYPSVSHVNGKSIDTDYLNSQANQEIFMRGLLDYGVFYHLYKGHSIPTIETNIKADTDTNPAIFKKIKCVDDSFHNDHLHSMNFTGN